MDRRTFLRTGAAAVVGGLVRPRLLFGGGAMERPRPNVLLLFADQHNAGVLGCAGNRIVQTPHLDALAAAGVRYSRAYCQNGICMPSRMSMLTGQYCRALGQYDNGLPLANPDRHPTLVAALRKAGYRTAAYGKRHLDPAIDHDWDEAFTTLAAGDVKQHGRYDDWIRERNLYDAHWRDFGPAPAAPAGQPLCCRVTSLPADATKTAFVADKTIAWIKRSAAEKKAPFFCWASFEHPHQPYTPLQKYVDLYAEARIDLPPSVNEDIAHFAEFIRVRRANTDTRTTWCFGAAVKNPELWRTYIRYYYALVSEIDHHIGRIVASLRETGQLDNTIIVYTSDHGELLAEHGCAEKMAWAHNVYEATLRVPLIIAGPGVGKAGRMADDLVEMVDLYPTLADLCRLDARAADRGALAGRSLADSLAAGKPVGRDYAVSENLVQVSVIGPRYKLGRWLRPTAVGLADQVFDRQADPWEMDNFAGKPQVAGEEKAMRRFLADWVARTPAAPYRPPSQGTRAGAPGYQNPPATQPSR